MFFCFFLKHFCGFLFKACLPAWGSYRFTPASAVGFHKAQEATISGGLDVPRPGEWWCRFAVLLVAFCSMFFGVFF